MVAVSAAQAVERIGMPEAQIILSQAVTYVATRTEEQCGYVCGLSNAMDDVREYKNAPVPVHLQDAHYKGAAEAGTWNRLQIRA